MVGERGATSALRVGRAALLCFAALATFPCDRPGLADEAPSHAFREALCAAVPGPGVSVEELIDFAQTHPELRQRVDVVLDWMAQDGVLDAGTITPETIRAVAGTPLANPDAESPALFAPYLDACEARRGARLEPYLGALSRIVFTKHLDMGGSHYAYTEAQSDAQAERRFEPGGALCLLALDGLHGEATALLDAGQGVIRDPDVSWDGQHVLFSWKQSLDGDDFHLYEMDLETGQVHPITAGLGFADYEGAYLPDGDIVLSSTRCVQTVDCWWTEVSNLYTCNADGRFLRRLGYDQVHTNFPTVTPDGRVVYTRWDYNDRGQIFPQGLFEMNPDGTGQTALYGNNSWFPTAILHARQIPGTRMYVAIFTGHHSLQQGWLGIVDPSRGREENTGAQLIAPVRATEAVRVDAYGQEGDAFQYPYPLDGHAFLVAMRPEGREHFGIYVVFDDGRRELLASDPSISCNQPLPLMARPVPPCRPDLPDYTGDAATVYLQDVHAGPGLSGIEGGAIRSLRVVALDFRAAGVGENENHGPAGGALASTPISIEGAWDVKRVLGEAPVYEDGSACFTVPARTPVYFQALDAQGCAVQTMRSWVTLQPGESVSCVGCHEDKNTSPPVTRVADAMQRGPQALTPWRSLSGEAGLTFDFTREVQPILDRHCTRCHNQRLEPSALGDGAVYARMVLDGRAGVWRYTEETPVGAWTAPGYDDSRWREARGDFGLDGTPGAQIATRWETEGIWLRRTLDLSEGGLPARPRALAIHDEDLDVYVNGALAIREEGFIAEPELLPLRGGATLFRVGRNCIAVHCRQTLGGQCVGVSLVDLGSAEASLRPDGTAPAFSLLGDTTFDPKSLRHWSDSYLALANRQFTNWVNIQSAPPMLAPYAAGAAVSPIIAMLEQGHYDVALSDDEGRRIATWIDLLVPFCGDYREGLTGDSLAKYEHYLEKRHGWEQEEARNIQQLLAWRSAKPFASRVEP